jgi:hypothetical protein
MGDYSIDNKTGYILIPTIWFLQEGSPVVPILGPKEKFITKYCSNS